VTLRRWQLVVGDLLGLAAGDARLTAEMATGGRAVHEELVLPDLLLDLCRG